MLLDLTMTQLTQLCSYLFVFSLIFLSCVLKIIPISDKFVNCFVIYIPIWILITFFCYLLFKLGLSIIMINDSVVGNEKLQKEIREAKLFYQNYDIKF